MTAFSLVCRANISPRGIYRTEKQQRNTLEVPKKGEYSEDISPAGFISLCSTSGIVVPIIVNQE